MFILHFQRKICLSSDIPHCIHKSYFFSPPTIAGALTLVFHRFGVLSLPKPSHGQSLQSLKTASTNRIRPSMISPKLTSGSEHTHRFCFDQTKIYLSPVCHREAISQFRSHFSDSLVQYSINHSIQATGRSSAPR